MKNKKYHPVGTIPMSNTKIVERCRIDTSNKTAQCSGLEHALQKPTKLPRLISSSRNVYDNLRFSIKTT